MRRGRARLSAILALAGVLVAGSAGADSILEFDIWMQKIDRHSQTILHALKRQDASAAVADARELERLYGQMERFYEARGEHDDPLLLSWDGRQRAASAAVQAQQGDFAGAFESAVGIARDCRACHDRFKPIKPQG